MDVIKRGFVSCLFTIIFVCSQNVVANEKDYYLSLLEAEAETSRLDSGKSTNEVHKQTNVKRHSSESVNNKFWLGECGAVGKVLPSNIQREEFSSYLEQCSMTTFSLYRKLESDLQFSIYAGYSKASSVTVRVLRKEILKIY